jgi:hypothetical protein
MAAPEAGAVPARVGAALPGSADAGLGDFVDRAKEMEQLAALCAEALRGARQIVLLDGPPGIGKTRAAAEIASQARALGFECHEGRTAAREARRGAARAAGPGPGARGRSTAASPGS